MSSQFKSIGCVWVLIAYCAAYGQAQDYFELLTPQAGLRSQAMITAHELLVTSSQGSVTRYQREPGYDSNDGQWIAYYSPTSNQILRWPASNSGNMQIGDVRGNEVRYRYTQMTVTNIGPTGQANSERDMRMPVLSAAPNGYVPHNARAPGADLNLLPSGLEVSDFFGQLWRGRQTDSLPAAQMLAIATWDDRGSPQWLSRGEGLEVLSAPVAGTAVSWWVAPTADGLIRVQTHHNDRIYVVSASSGGSVRLLPLAQDPRQLWRVTGVGRNENRFVLESVQYPGFGLSHTVGGIVLQPLHFASGQLWMPWLPPAPVGLQAFYRTITQELVANPPLPPARLELINTHRNALIVLWGDNRTGTPIDQVRIAPQSSLELSLERDAGSTIVETLEVLSPLGVWERQQFVTSVPPSTFYDLSVYEEHLQSIAIDRTGKSPQVIEDINYVPKSVGWFALPTGPELAENSQLDVYSRARAANNPGAVRRLDFEQFEAGPPVDRLERLLQEVQSSPRRRF